MDRSDEERGRVLNRAWTGGARIEEREFKDNGGMEEMRIEGKGYGRDEDRGKGMEERYRHTPRVLACL